MVVNWHWGRCFFPQVFALIFVCRKFDLIGSGIIRNPLSNQLYFYRAWLYLKPICKNWLTHHRLVDELHPQILKQKMHLPQNSRAWLRIFHFSFDHPWTLLPYRRSLPPPRPAFTDLYFCKKILHGKFIHQRQNRSAPRKVRYEKMQTKRQKIRHGNMWEKLAVANLV